MNDYRVLVTGSRDWVDRATLVQRLTKAYDAALRAESRLVVVHGHCPKGADRLAHLWVTAMRGAGWDVDEEARPANWSEGRGAGFDRNERMVMSGADECLAFAMPCTKRSCVRPGEHYSHGTTHCASLAERAGIPVEYVEPRPMVAS